MFWNAPRGALGKKTKTAARETRPTYEAYKYKRVYSLIFLCHNHLCEPEVLFYQGYKNKHHSVFSYLGKSSIWRETLGFFPTFTWNTKTRFEENLLISKKAFIHIYFSEKALHVESFHQFHTKRRLMRVSLMGSMSKRDGSTVGPFLENSHHTRRFSSSFETACWTPASNFWGLIAGQNFLKLFNLFKNMLSFTEILSWSFLNSLFCTHTY